MARLYLKKTAAGFEPADEASLDAWRKFKRGEVYRGDVVKPRSYQHHKQIMALLNLTFENQEQYEDFEQFRKAVAVAAGHVEELVTFDGEVIRLPKSIDWSTLDEIQFTRVAASMMTVCAHLMHDMGLSELRDEVSKYADQHYGMAS